MERSITGVYIRNVILLTAAILTIVFSASLLMQNVFAQDVDEATITSTHEYIYPADLESNDAHETIFSPKFISVTFINERYEGFTYAETVEDAIADLGLEIEANHIVKPDLNFVVSEDLHVRVNEVIQKQYTETESIPFESVSVSDPEMEIYTRATKQVGRNGTKELTYEQTFVNGILDATELVSEVVTLHPQDEIIAIGTKVIPSEDVSACKEMGSTYWTEYINTMDAEPQEKDWLLCVSACESGRNNCRVSGTGIYFGIMQYLPSTFTNAGGTSIWNGAEQLTFALIHYRGGGASAWGSCNAMCSL